MKRISLRPWRALVLVGLLGLPALGRAASTIMSLSYSCPDPVIHIGSAIKVYLTALNITQSLNISSVAATATDVTLNSTDFSIGVPVFITDGERVWSTVYTGFPANAVTVNNTHLIGPVVPTGWALADYSVLSNQNFKVYTGSLVTNLIGGPASADVGSLDNQVLVDDGTSGDDNGSNGIWTGIYNVRDLGQQVTGAHLFGHMLVSGVPASNDGFSGTKALDLDMLRPDIKNIAFSTNKMNYAGVMYVSNFSQGKSSLVSANVDPTNAQGRFDIEVNKRDTVVDVEIVNTMTASKLLPPLVFPSQAASLNGWRIWDGTDGVAPPSAVAAAFVPDGIYSVNLHIRDGNGVVGITRTTQVKVISMKMEIKNITLSPPLMASQPAFTNGVITQVNYDVVLSQAVGGGDLSSSLSVLGWDRGPLGTWNNLSPGSTVWSLRDFDFLKPDGTVGSIVVSDGDLSSADDDLSVASTKFPNYFTNSFGGAMAPLICPHGLAAGSIVNNGDGAIFNDWFTVLEQFSVTNGTNAVPVSMTAHHSHTQTGPTPDEGSYRLAIKDSLTGLSFNTTQAQNPDMPDPCVVASPPAFRSNTIHFYPDIRPEGATPNRGQGLFTEDSSVIFSVLANASPTLDNTPPIYLASDPQDSSIVAPATYGPGKPLTAQFRDFESSINTNGSVSFGRIKDPQGGFVGGVSSTNGGGIGNSVDIRFSPYSNITTGGDYIFQVFTCNSGGLCIQKDLKFRVQDQTVPSISAIELVQQSGPPNIALDPLQPLPQGPYENIDKIMVTLAFANQTSNVIDGAASSVSLYQVSGTVQIAVPMTRQSSSNANQLIYKIDSAITYAGRFKITVQTFSHDSSGNNYQGPPPGAVVPEFTTVVCSSCLTVLYTNNPDNSRPAISGKLPLAITLNGNPGSPVPSTAVGVRKPLSTPVDPGFLHLNTFNNNDSMQFYNVGAPLSASTERLQWTWTAPSSVVFKLYYDDSDLAAIPESQLQARGFDGSSWQSVVAQVDSLPSTANSFTIIPPSGALAFLYYAIGYPSTAPGVTPVPTPTALAFKNTRSFSPSHANPIYRKARFYYSETPPKDVDVKIYDTAGVLVKSMGLGSGVQMGDTITDPTSLRTSYYFQWDGRNDSGDAVKNGLYLVRWRVTRLDGSSDTVVKPVALIK